MKTETITINPEALTNLINILKQRKTKKP